MDTSQIEQFRIFKNEITRFMMVYKFALDAIDTKLEILKEEFQILHDYNPIEHTKSRLKSPESIMKKLFNKGCEITLPSIRENIRDIAGIRITCSFISDIYWLCEMLKGQSDLKILYWCGRGTSYVQEEQRPFTRTHAPLFQTTAPIKVLENK